MQLNDSLKIDLLAIISRYPDCVVELDETLLGLSVCWEKDCSPERALELLHVHAGDLLETSACVVIDSQQPVSEIYLIKSRKHPAFHLYCGRCFRIQQRKHFLRESSINFPFITIH